MNSAYEFFQKYRRIITIALGTIIALLVIYALRLVFLPLGIALVLAYIMMPLVAWIEARLPLNWRWFASNRTYAIAFTYLIIALVLGVFSFFTFITVLNAVHSLTHNSVAYFSSASDTLKQWTESLRQLVPLELREQVDTYIQEMGVTLLDSVHKSIMNGMEKLPTQLGYIAGLASVPFFLYYVLKDQKKFISNLYSSAPDWAVPHAQSISSIVAETFRRYIRATLVQGLVVGILTLIGLLIIQAPLAPLLAVLSGVTEMIPLVGPWIGGTMAVIVAIALAPDKVIWVAVVALSVQLLENFLIVPRIQSAFFKIHPIITLSLIMTGGYIGGVLGMVLIMPLTAITVGIYKYCCELSPGKSDLKEERPNIDNRSSERS